MRCSYPGRTSRFLSRSFLTACVDDSKSCVSTCVGQCECSEQCSAKTATYDDKCVEDCCYDAILNKQNEFNYHSTESISMPKTLPPTLAIIFTTTEPALAIEKVKESSEEEDDSDEEFFAPYQYPVPVETDTISGEHTLAYTPTSTFILNGDATTNTASQATFNPTTTAPTTVASKPTSSPTTATKAVSTTEVQRTALPAVAAEVPLGILVTGEEGHLD
ncbi:hypothetical protein PoB_004105500 [Plakobranchus ocellatus]|uniref:Uncharacterized protein n=1 Tax=Plakobranchus ocellatus TaxID=259542 RepID=A0AAV4B669_9GAST|nr:hypothetical protein PoB_004105500 [Plakobranchus ocellatus]